MTGFVDYQDLRKIEIMCIKCSEDPLACCPIHGCRCQARQEAQQNSVSTKKLPSSCTLDADPLLKPEPTKQIIFKQAENVKKTSLGECAGMIIGPYERKTKILHVINGGSFGHIYLGECLTANKHVAIKAEKQGSGQEKLLHEGNVYSKLEGGPGIPQVYWYGMHGAKYNFLIMEALGPSLAELFHQYDDRFNLSTVIRILIDAFHIIRHIHSQNYLHRDISPDNFVISRDSTKHKLYLIDYGLAKKCASPGQLRLSPNSRYGFQYSRPMVGTPRFASLGAHQGAEEGRRDDLESLCYMGIYFLKGSLPWQGQSTNNEHNRFAEIARLKATIPISELCKDLPTEFEKFLDYIRLLKPYEVPDYSGLVNLFQGLATQENIDLNNNMYEWTEHLAKTE